PFRLRQSSRASPRRLRRDHWQALPLLRLLLLAPDALLFHRLRPRSLVAHVGFSFFLGFVGYSGSCRRSGLIFPLIVWRRGRAGQTGGAACLRPPANLLRETLPDAAVRGGIE